MFYRKNQNRLGFRLLFLILIGSSAFTLCTTGLQLYSDYRTDVDIIEKKIRQIHDIHVKSIRVFLWEMDHEAVSLLLESILQTTEIEYIDIVRNALTTVKVGNKVSKNTLLYSYPVLYQEPPFDEVLGELNIVVSLDKVQDRIKDRFFVILGTNAVKTFLMSLFILMVFQILVTRHLKVMANYARNLDFNKLDKDLTLSKRFGKKQDEIDVVVNSLNEMRQRLKTSYLDLEGKNRKLLRIDQLKDQFLANTSHELKTPLTGIIGIIGIMREKIQTDPTVTINRYLSLINTSSKKLLHLVNDILDFSKLKHESLNLNLQPIDLKVVADVVMSLSEILISNKPVRLSNLIPEGLPLVKADETRIQQVFHNLIGNAIKFTKQGEIIVSARVEQERVLVSVRDSGIGIDPEFHEAIFNSFEQLDGSLDREYSGIGLGLSITRKLIHNHGGRISVTSQIGKGSEFRFDLPIAANNELIKHRQRHFLVKPEVIEHHSLDESTEIDEPSARPEAHYQILIVEDEPNTLQILRYYLQNEGFNVLVATNGEEALRSVDTRRPDLVLLDIMIPVIDGYRVCQTIRKTYTSQDLPIVLLSAKNQLDDKLLGLSVGANDYIEKPIHKRELFLRIQNQLQLLNANRRMISILEFARKIGDFKDSKSLITEAFTQIEKNVYFNAGLLMQNDAMVRQTGQTDLISFLMAAYADRVSNFREFECINLTGSNPGSLLYFVFKGFEEYQVLLFRREINGIFMNNTLQYLKNIINEVHGIRSSICKFSRADFPHDAIMKIKSELERIIYIRSLSPHCEIVLENESIRYEIPITMQEIELYLGDHILCRVHRKYFAVPEKAKKVQKKGRDFDLVYSQSIIPIGRSYLKKIQRSHSYLFETEHGPKR